MRNIPQIRLFIRQVNVLFFTLERFKTWVVSMSRQESPHQLELTTSRAHMATEEFALTAGIAGAAYVAQQLFGKTLAEMGDDLNNVYKSNRDKLLAKAASKVDDPNDGAKPNLRVARDVIWNGAVTDDEVCAEYFGGLLAASRSEDGKDDSALIYVDCIKALSSKQLHLHFVIYDSLQSLLLKAGKNLNPGIRTNFRGRRSGFRRLNWCHALA